MVRNISLHVKYPRDTRAMHGYIYNSVDVAELT